MVVPLQPKTKTFLQMNTPINSKEFLATVNNAIERLMRINKLNATQLAGELGLNQQHMRRLIRQSTGMSSANYITSIKIGRAKELLIKQDLLAVAKVGYLCGYDEATHFTRFFRNAVGMTPSEYRAKHRDTMHSYL